MTLEVGQTLAGRYTVRAPISRGGFAEVYRVEHDQLGTVHALKLLRIPDPDHQRRLLLEGRQQARLHHPNLVRVTDTIALPQGAALIMEFVDGPTLSGLLQQGLLSLEDAVTIGTGILSGVQHAHEAGLIHRDLKPQNILMAGQTPRITDFGLARRIAAPSQTRSGIAMGTPGYMAPEQYNDARSVGVRADIFSLGCVLYELLVSQPAFSGHGMGALMIQAMRERFRPLRSLRANLPDHLVNAVHAALSAAQQGRPASVAALSAWWQGDPPIRSVVLQAQTFIPTSSAGDISSGGTHPSLDALLDGAHRPDVAEHLAACPACRAELKMFQAFHETPAESPHNLPRARDRFIGRQTELRDLSAQLAPGQLVTLMGMGGLGKTRLSIEAGRQVRPNWPGGVWFCDLAEARSTRGLVAAIARVLDVPLKQSPIDQIGQALSSRGRVLLILDNFEQVVDAAAETVGRWLDTAPNVGFLATSRIPLRLTGEQVVPLEPLDEDHGIALFRERAAAAGGTRNLTGATLDDLAAVIRMLDGLPLAIELAASRTRMLPPAALRQRLSRRFALLKSRSMERPARQRTLYATIQWSWELLRPEEQAALAQVAVFEGRFTVDAAEAVVDLSDFEDVWLDDVLASLVDQSLLLSEADPQHGAQLRMLVSVRAFASAQLTDREAAERRHGEHFAGAGHPQALQALTGRGGIIRMASLIEDLDDLIAACRRHIPRDDVDIVYPCALAAWEVLIHRGPFSTGVALLHQARQTPSLSNAQRINLLYREARLHRLMNAPDAVMAILEVAQPMLGGQQRTIEAAMVFDLLGSFLYDKCNWAESIEAYAQGRAAAVISNAQSLEAEILRHMGAALHRQNRVEEAEQVFHAALAIQRARGDRKGEASLVNNLGVVLHHSGHLTEAQAHFERAIRLHQATHNQHGWAVAVGNLAVLQRERGELDAAEENVRQALPVHRAMGDRLSETIAINLLGDLAKLQGRFEEAEQRYLEVLRYRTESGARLGESILLCNLGILYRAQGRHADALRCYTDALEIRQDLDDVFGQATILTNLGVLFEKEGQADEAERCHREALALLTEQNAPRNEAIALVNLGALLMKRGQVETGQPLLQRAVEIGDALPAANVSAAGRRHLATIAEARGDIDHARALLVQAEAIIRATNSNIDLTETLCVRSAFEQRNGEREAASRFREEAEALVRQMDIMPGSELGQTVAGLKPPE
ncbi:MAG: tetratricopeptide repeat protein [Myxococcota bacterium]